VGPRTLSTRGSHLNQQNPREENPEILFKSAFIISGCPGDSERYRSTHQAEQLELLGIPVETALSDRVDYDSIVSRFELFVLHRVPHTLGLERFIQRARAAGKVVVFDTDDLLFDASLASQIKALRNYTQEEINMCLEEMRGHQRTMSLCSAILVTTETLRDSVAELFPQMPVYINRNAVSDVMMRQAENALQAGTDKSDEYVRIAYFSGTRTHQDDFDECAPALSRLLLQYSWIRLMIAGHLDVPEILQSCSDRLEVEPWVPWEELPNLLRRTNINLAPLEMNNRFTASKSELKYFEAGLLGVPTVASKVHSYQTAISHGQNGFLCSSGWEWHDALERLVNDPELRECVGRNAKRDVLLRYTTRARAPEFRLILADIRANLGT
jgi:O-antigen biosynthesis protein